MEQYRVLPMDCTQYQIGNEIIIKEDNEEINEGIKQEIKEEPLEVDVGTVWINEESAVKDDREMLSDETEQADSLDTKDPLALPATAPLDPEGQPLPMQWVLLPPGTFPTGAMPTNTSPMGTSVASALSVGTIPMAALTGQQMLVTSFLTPIQEIVNHNGNICIPSFNSTVALESGAAPGALSGCASILPAPAPPPAAPTVTQHQALHQMSEQTWTAERASGLPPPLPGVRPLLPKLSWLLPPLAKEQFSLPSNEPQTPQPAPKLSPAEAAREMVQGQAPLPANEPMQELEKQPAPAVWALDPHTEELLASGLPFRCSKCPAAYRTFPELRVHMAEHAPRPVRLLCDRCGWQMVNNSKLHDHQLRRCRRADDSPLRKPPPYHPRKPKKPLLPPVKQRCLICGCQFWRVPSLKRHYRKKHQIEAHLVKHLSEISSEPNSTCQQSSEPIINSEKSNLTSEQSSAVVSAVEVLSASVSTSESATTSDPSKKCTSDSELAEGLPTISEESVSLATVTTSASALSLRAQSTLHTLASPVPTPEVSVSPSATSVPIPTPASPNSPNLSSNSNCTSLLTGKMAVRKAKRTTPSVVLTKSIATTPVTSALKYSGAIAGPVTNKAIVAAAAKALATTSAARARAIAVAAAAPKSLSGKVLFSSKLTERIKAAAAASTATSRRPVVGIASNRTSVTSPTHPLPPIRSSGEDPSTTTGVVTTLKKKAALIPEKKAKLTPLVTETRVKGRGNLTRDVTTTPLENMANSTPVAMATRLRKKAIKPISTVTSSAENATLTPIVPEKKAELIRVAKMRSLQKRALLTSVVTEATRVNKKAISTPPVTVGKKAKLIPFVKLTRLEENPILTPVVTASRHTEKAKMTPVVTATRDRRKDKLTTDLTEARVNEESKLTPIVTATMVEKRAKLTSVVAATRGKRNITWTPVATATTVEKKAKSTTVATAETSGVTSVSLSNSSVLPGRVTTPSVQTPALPTSTTKDISVTTAAMQVGVMNSLDSPVSTSPVSRTTGASALIATVSHLSTPATPLFSVALDETVLTLEDAAARGLLFRATNFPLLNTEADLCQNQPRLRPIAPKPTCSKTTFLVQEVEPESDPVPSEETSNNKRRLDHDPSLTSSSKRKFLKRKLQAIVDAEYSEFRGNPTKETSRRARQSDPSTSRTSSSKQKIQRRIQQSSAAGAVRHFLPEARAQLVRSIKDSLSEHRKYLVSKFRHGTRDTTQVPSGLQSHQASLPLHPPLVSFLSAAQKVL